MDGIIKDYAQILKAPNLVDVVDIPTLFIRGGLSDYINLDTHPATIHRLFSNARIETLPHASHWVHADDYSGFMGLLGGI